MIFRNKALPSIVPCYGLSMSSSGHAKTVAIASVTLDVKLITSTAPLLASEHVFCGISYLLTITSSIPWSKQYLQLHLQIDFQFQLEELAQKHSNLKLAKQHRTYDMFVGQQMILLSFAPYFFEKKPGSGPPMGWLPVFSANKSMTSPAAPGWPRISAWHRSSWAAQRSFRSICFPLKKPVFHRESCWFFLLIFFPCLWTSWGFKHFEQICRKHGRFVGKIAKDFRTNLKSSFQFVSRSLG